MELLWVILVIGVLVIVALPSLNYIRDYAKSVRAAEELRALERDISTWTVEKGALPTSIDQIRPGGMNDPWGRPYIYETSAQADALHMRRTTGGAIGNVNDDYDLFSTGVDGQFEASLNAEQSKDDIIRTGNGGWVGIVRKMNDF